MHGFKYRLAFVVNGVCVLRYDNEAGKGDHDFGLTFEDLSPADQKALQAVVDDFHRRAAELA